MKFVILAALIAVAAADVAYPAYSAPAYSAPSYSAPAYSAPAYGYEARRPHYFAWDVKDDYSYVNMGHNENADGKVVSGSYHVLLPDGRTQTVTYKDDGYGYVAEVKYDGYAKYPEYTKPAYSAPAYAPAY